MSETLLPMAEQEWKQPPMTAPKDLSLATRLSVIEGEVLTYLEQYGATPLRRLTRELEWPSTMILMAIGGLTREGLARALQHELEVIVEPVRKPVREGPAPEVWGG